MTVPYIFANAVGLVPASELDVNFDYVSNNVSTANTVVANAQPNITSVGTLTSLSTSGNIRGGNLLTAGTISATGTITTAGNLSLTGNIVDLGELWINTLSNGNINLNVNGTGNVNIPTGILGVTGNIQGGNLKTAGLVSATANITGGNLLTGGLVSATANVTGGNVLTAGVVSATANITGGNLLTAGLISATSTITSDANVTGGNILTGGLISATANITGGNIITGGQVSATGNVTGGNLSGTNIEGTLTTASQTNITSVGTLDSLSATGNIRTGGFVSAAGNVLGGNIRTVGLITATGNVTAGNVQTGGIVSAVGNITAANFFGNGNTLSNVATQVVSSWTLAAGTNTVSFTVPLNGTYSLWIIGNIANGIVTYNATAVVTNPNVPVLGSQFGWYYEVGNALVLTAIPDQFVGTNNAISNVMVVTTTANVFTFGIINNSGNSVVVDYGYTKLS
jgi:hypothetical protein